MCPKVVVRDQVEEALIRRVGSGGLTNRYPVDQPIKTYGQSDQIVAALRKSRLLREQPQARR